MEFWGYERPNGSVGIRNYVMILPASMCINEMAVKIAEKAGPGVIALTHNHNCVYLPPDKKRAERALVGLGLNPNVAATIIVGIGCEDISAEVLADGISPANKPLEIFTIEKEGSYQNVIDKAVLASRKMLSDVSIMRKHPFGLKHLTLGVKCGGSGGLSGVGCNAISGEASNAIVASGGSVIFSETAEIIGAEQILAKRAVNKKVAQDIYKVSERLQDRFQNAGVSLTEGEPTPGNKKEGLTTMEEKSLGAIIKGGNSTLQGVLEWAEKPKGKGLYFMDGSALTSKVYVGLAAAGAQMATFNLSSGLVTSFRTPPTFGRGVPILPVIKIVNTTEDNDYFDIVLDDVINGQESIAQVGKRLLEEIIAISSGKLTKMEMLPPFIQMLELYAISPTI